MRRALAIAVVLAAALAAAAGAQAPGDAVRVDPNKAGIASHFLVDVRVSEDPKAAGRSPTAAVIGSSAGFKFDPRARSERCSAERAKGFDCPANSRIGTGTANATLVHNGGVFAPQPLVIDVQAFLAPAQQSGDLAGMVLAFKERSSGQQGTTTGRVVKSGGVEVRFEDLAGAAQAPDGFTLRVDRIQLDVGASRTEKVTVCCKTVRRNGKKKKVRYKKKVRRDLIRNPRTCSGSWPYQVRLRYSASDESVRDGSVACTP
jgi:hypothetical protein